MKIYLVGGAVRDQLLGIKNQDRDWVVVGATAEQMIAQGYQPVGKDFPVFLHPTTREEYALARTERKSGHGYHGFTCYAAPDVTLKEDLQRRDLTINAIAQDNQGELIDPFNGAEDLAQKCLRHVSPAFAEDPLRVLRVARFAARYHHLGFYIAEETVDLMRSMVNSGEVDHLVSERIWQEIVKAIQTQSPWVFFTTLQQVGALERILPDLARVWRISNLPQQTLKVAKQQLVSDEVLLSCAFLLQIQPDKPYTSTEVKSAQNQTKQLMESLKAPNNIRQLSLLVNQFWTGLMRLDLSASDLLDIFDRADAWRRSERFMMLLQGIQCIAVNVPYLTQQQVSKHINTIYQQWQTALTIKPGPFLNQGITGKALGTAIHEARLKAIQSFGGVTESTQD
ncbi:hypothetical protein [Zooshikella sp. RANM57]|uniref:hypothetical protein n=1 Tax=Zooshikella sp. RANM57 TaxID=3425863 RepID=UPI003D6FA739